MMSDKGGVSESFSEVNASKPLNIQRALLMRSMSNEELVHKLRQYYPSLQKIKEKKVESSRHNDFMQGPPCKRAKLQHASNSITCITGDQSLVVMNELANYFVGSSSQMFAYSMNVLLPEALLLIAMDKFDINQEEAEDVLHANVFTITSTTSDSEEELEYDSTVDDFIKKGKELLERTKNFSVEFFTLELLAACNNKASSNLLGTGGYGSVYKGKLRHTSVAIKFLTKEVMLLLRKCSTSHGSTQQLRQELGALYKFRHPNIVPLMGYCYGLHPTLVYEYVSGGSLYQWLHQCDEPLKWYPRGTILSDACRGLCYLHCAEPKSLVHQDIKSHNILVDQPSSDTYIGKLCDFGFSIELPKVREDGRSMFTAKGFAKSEGYYPPELMYGMYSPKSDVYSYGVVVLETYTGKVAYDPRRKDPNVVDFFDEAIKESSDTKKFVAASDPRVTECPTHLMAVMSDIVKAAITKHSIRATSEQVMEKWDSFISQK